MLNSVVCIRCLRLWLRVCLVFLISLVFCLWLLLINSVVRMFCCGLYVGF